MNVGWVMKEADDGGGTVDWGGAQWHPVPALEGQAYIWR